MKLFAAITFCLWVGPLWGASDTTKRVTDLMSKRDRLAAVHYLRSLQQKKNSKDVDEEIRGLMTRVAEQFFSEKALSDYQMAESIFQRDSKRALDIYLKTLELEPQNVLLVASLVDALLINDNCKEIRRYLLTVEDLYPKHPLVVLKRVQEQDCLQNQNIETSDSKNESKGFSLLDYYFAKNKVREGQLLQSSKVLDSFKHSDLEKFPEIWFLRWQVEAAKEARQVAANEYVKLCDKSVDLAPKPYRSVREYCKQKEAMQKFLKGLNDAGTDED